LLILALFCYRKEVFEKKKKSNQRASRAICLLLHVSRLVWSRLVFRLHSFSTNVGPGTTCLMHPSFVKVVSISSTIKTIHSHADRPKCMMDRCLSNVCVSVFLSSFVCLFLSLCFFERGDGRAASIALGQHLFVDLIGWTQLCLSFLGQACVRSCPLAVCSVHCFLYNMIDLSRQVPD